MFCLVGLFYFWSVVSFYSAFIYYLCLVCESFSSNMRRSCDLFHKEDGAKASYDLLWLSLPYISGRTKQAIWNSATPFFPPLFFKNSSCFWSFHFLICFPTEALLFQGGERCGGAGSSPTALLLFCTALLLFFWSTGDAQAVPCRVSQVSLHFWRALLAQEEFVGAHTISLLPPKSPLWP